MNDPRVPHVVAFYAYKGGTGRTTAIVHVASALACRGRRIAMIDLDLGAPGLWPLLHPDEPAPAGFLEYVSAHLRGEKPAVGEYLHRLDLAPEARGALQLMSAGRMDDQYLRELESLDWQSLLVRLTPHGQLDMFGSGAGAFQFLIDSLADQVDAVFLDAPTGLTDTANVSLRCLADTVVALFAPTRVHLDGIGRVLGLLAKEQQNQGRPEIFCVASTLMQRRVTGILHERLKKAFEFLNRVRFDALGRPPLDNQETLDAVEQPVAMISYDSGLADLDALSAADVGDEVESVFEDVTVYLNEALPPALLDAPTPRLQLDPKSEKPMLLEELLHRFPSPIAEQENDPDLFLATEYVQAVRDGSDVLILGGKGSGKTALFRHLTTSGPAAGIECLAVHGFGTVQLQMDVLSAMVDAGLQMDAVWRLYALAQYPHPLSLPTTDTRLAGALQEIRSVIRNEVRFDPSGSALRASELPQLAHEAWANVDASLKNRDTRLLLLIDGLDAPFKGDPERRSKAVSQLFVGWQATFSMLRNVTLKVFLRTDLWQGLSFPEKSHLQPLQVELKWEPRTLWQLLVKRALGSKRFGSWCERSHLQPRISLDGVEAAAERALVPYLDALFEERIWAGKNSLSRNWLLRRLTDARDMRYPRDVLTLIRCALQGEQERLRENKRIALDSAASRESLAGALAQTSQQRVDAVKEEYPELVEVLQRLRGQNAQGRFDVLRDYLAARPSSRAAQEVEWLQRAGVMKVQEKGEYSVPDLYVPGLGMKRPGPK